MESDSDCFITAVNALRKPQDKRKLLQILILIRKGIDDTPTKLQKLSILSSLGSIKNLIGCLQLEHNNILDITLSILGNCCIDLDFARSAVKLNILHYLDRVLDKHSKDSIIGRVFRIIGNLCDCNRICSATVISKEPLLIDKIVDFLNKRADRSPDALEETSEATVLMAVRTLRKLLKKSTLQSLVIEHQVLRTVGAILIKYVEQWEENNKNQNVIEEVLRLLYTYSHYTHPNIIESLKNTENGDSLIYLGKLITFNPTKVTTIFVNLSKYCSLKSDLPIPDIWLRLLGKIRTDVEEPNYLEYLKNMCKLIENPSNRTNMNLADSICQLVDALKSFGICTDFSMECCTLILSMLNKTQYDDVLVLKQISADIINVLISKLEWMGASSTKLLVHHVKKKRKGRLLGNNRKKFKLIMDCDSSSSSSYNIVSHEDRCTSPSELSEISSDGPYSPIGATNAESWSDSDNYSPVCSDAEDGDINSVPSLNATDVEYGTASDDEDVISLNGRNKTRLLFEINSLLWRYSRVKPPVIDLGNLQLLTTLMNLTLTNENSSSCQQLLMVILKKSDYLIPLMQTKFVQMVYELTTTTHDIKHCSFCNRIYEIATTILNTLTKTAESGIGKGDIAHTLLRSNAQVKNKMVVTIPYIIRNKNLITKLLINCGGLDILLNLIEKISDVQEDSIKGLCVLAIHQLKIKNPVHNQPQRKLCNFDVNDYRISETCLNVVTFKLDDGSSIFADREFLSNKSDYFNRLLCGSFKESEQSEITLQNISTKSLKLLLLLLHCHISSLGIINFDLDTFLDLLEITERYLLVELNVYLTGCVEQLHMSNKTVPLIYQWSIESGTNILRVETIAFALVGDIMDADRIDMFHDLFGLGYYNQLTEDIKKLLIRFLR